MSSKKFNNMSEQLRNEGNELFKSKNFLEAIEKYNESLNCAKSAGNSLLEALAHGNRSAAHIELGMLAHCMFDIRMARTKGFPQDKLAKLMDRAQRCFKMLTQARMANKFKSNAVAKALRDQGNKLFSAGKFTEALLKYNESLCYANDDLNLALSYANRSATFLELGHYPQCIKNIKLAREHGYPADKVKKLEDREMRCLEEMAKVTKISSEPADDIFKLSYEPNPKIPFMINDLELCQNEKYGRHLITNRDLKPGDIISIEVPYGRFVTNGFTQSPGEFLDYQVCAFCLFGNRLDLIPCTKCNITMYCNQECAEKAHKIHKTECSNMAFAVMAGGSYYNPSRHCDMALGICGGSYNELKKLFDEHKKSPKTFYELDFSNPDDPEYTKNQLRAVMSMAQREDENFEGKETSKIKLRDYMSETIPPPPPFMKDLFQHMDGITLGAGEQIPIASRDCAGGFGHGHYFSAGFMNHSCNPNAVPVWIHRVGAVVVTRPIAKGEQIFTCYTQPFFDANREERRQSMPRSFKCDCEACERPQKFTTLNGLKSYNPKILTLAKTFNPTSSMSKDQLIKNFKIITSKLQHIYKPHQFPSQEYAVYVKLLISTIYAITDFQIKTGELCK